MSPIRPRKPEDFKEPVGAKCRVCGCTEEEACEGGCYWVEKDLCSTCANMDTKILITVQVYVRGMVRAAHTTMAFLDLYAATKSTDGLAKMLGRVEETDLREFFGEKRTKAVLKEAMARFKPYREGKGG